MVKERKCSWCKRKFTPDDSQDLYCDTCDVFGAGIALGVFFGLPTLLALILNPTHVIFNLIILGITLIISIIIAEKWWFGYKAPINSLAVGLGLKASYIGIAFITSIIPIAIIMHTGRIISENAKELIDLIILTTITIGPTIGMATITIIGFIIYVKINMIIKERKELENKNKTTNKRKSKQTRKR